MTHIEIREKFLKFFEARGHKIVPSSSLLPTDPSVLFTTAGMQPMIPYLLGEVHPEGKRIANSQKCFRAQDIDEVGDNRHTTFFEMLGNWSFGDYFKREQLTWVFEFLIDEIKIDLNNFYVTVFAGNDQIPRDTESVKIWQELFKGKNIDAVDVENPAKNGMQNGRIFYYEKNWWSRSGDNPDDMPAGEPGGPDSEMFYDFGDIGQHDPQKYGQHCHVNCDCGRFLEIGNNVFMQYQKQEDGRFGILPQKNIDFGGGLERIAAASENQADIFKTSAFKPIIEKIKELAPKYNTYNDKKNNYDTDGNIRTWMRIVADHTKAATILASESIIPSNKTQGSMLRRLVTDAVSYMRVLEMRPDSISDVAQVVIDMYASAYPDLAAQQEKIKSVLQAEEREVHQKIERGLKEISKYDKVDAKVADKLHQSFGLPLEWIRRHAPNSGKDINEEDLEKLIEKHKQVSGAGAEKKFGGHGLILDTGELKAGNEEELKKATRLHTATHLLHASLRKILGVEVKQAGSDITAERLRFDFTFPRKMTPEEIKDVENLVNEAIQNDYQVTKKEMPYEEAIKSGALAFFKLKYPPMVNVYTVGPDDSPFSRELCGGPHVERTGDLASERDPEGHPRGKFKIIKEESVSAGTRRIRAIVE